ncbi:hypothetical protein Q31b_04270 [Novipirellula aureliae]|uniref:Uncharacterized protein n=1 Tax=Novipirellula aureliae TaxID=2527966 RepID=A0A5C6ECI7_9BACT|nr:hypothetical protein [Novipirellula aureliae]TWU45256.1 hypothetical protein Q31b_04270 [Novipirellula aureliae]
MDTQKIKDLFIQHVEKAVLAVFVLFSLLLVYQALKIESFEKQPEKLRTDANNVAQQVDVNHNEEIIPLREPKEDILARTNAAQTPVDPSIYVIKEPWQRLSVDTEFKRKDPTIFPPTDLIAKGVVRSLAIRSTDPQYPLLDKEFAKYLIPEDQGRRPRGGARSGRGNPMRGDYVDDYEMGSTDMVDRARGRGDRGPNAVVVEQPNWFAEPEINESLYSPPPNLTDFRDSRVEQYPVPQIARFVAGVAVLPHGKIYQSYRKALEVESADYRPNDRDTPKYWNFQVQRADVTNKSVDQLTERDWVDRRDRAYHTKLAALYWAGFAPELVPVDYRDSMITTWIPPVLMDEYASFTMHPKIPTLTQMEIDEIENTEELRITDPNSIFAQDGTITGVDIAGPEFSMADSLDNEYGGRMGSGYDTTSRSMYGYTGIETRPAEYKLVRFYDMAIGNDPQAPKMGRKYVYRVRISVNDPNFPSDPMLQPKTSSLAPDVYGRVSELIAKAERIFQEKTAKRERFDPSTIREFERWSEWSEPSNPVQLPTGNGYLVGPVSGAETTTLSFQNRSVPYEKKPATAKMVVTAYDPSVQTKVSLEIDVAEGSVLSAEKVKIESDKPTVTETEGEKGVVVIDPFTLAAHSLDSAKIKSRNTVVGIEGGQRLQIVEEDEMTQPGLILVADEDGKLRLGQELDDLQSYRAHSFAVQKESHVESN